jgi:hypothetical protein
VPHRGWINPDKLVDAASDLAAHQPGPGRPRHTLLRQAVSTAYYAVFHVLCVETAHTLLPNGTDDQCLSLVRAFSHRDTKDCCAWIARRAGKIPKPVRPLVDALGQPQSPYLHVSDAFCDLQEARHRADYDHFAMFSKATVLAHVQDARRCLSDVRGAPDPDRQAFAALVALRTAMR